MKKRLVAALCSAVMVFSLAACGNSGGSQNGGEDGQNSDGNSDDEIVEIFWQFPTTGEFSEAFYRMEDALNEMMEKDIGVHVTFVATTLTDSQQDATLAVSTGEQLDISLTAFTALGNLVENGMIMELDDLLEEYGPDIVSHAGNKVDGCYYDGKLYAVPTCADQVWKT